MRNSVDVDVGLKVLSLAVLSETVTGILLNGTVPPNFKGVTALLGLALIGWVVSSIIRPAKMR